LTERISPVLCGWRRPVRFADANSDLCKQTMRRQGDPLPGQAGPR
jgi:hypothetical protein